MFPLAKTALVALTFAIAGCATIGDHEDKIALDTEISNQARQQLDNARTSGAVIRMSTPKIGGDEVMLQKPSDLPAIFNQPFYYSAAFSSNALLLNDISRRTGMRIIQQRDVEGAAQPIPPSPEELSVTRSLEWTGTLGGLLDLVTSRLNRFWVYRDGAIQIIRTDTRTFSIYLPGGTKNLTANIALSGTGEDAGGAVSVSSANQINPYEPILKSITALVAEGQPSLPENSVVLNQALGILTVTATPPQLDKIQTIINSINDRFAQNVLVGVKVYSLTMSKDAAIGGAADIAYQSIARKFNASLLGAPLPTTSAGTPGQLIFNTSSPDFQGTNALVQALNDIGRVSFVTSGQVVAANGQPSPLQVANEITYLASSSTTQGVNTGVTTTLEPETLKVGFTANFLPLILGDNRILLQYQINISSLISLTSISSGDSTIQTPNVASQSLQQQAYLRDGQSIVLFGFEQDRTSTQTRGSITSLGKSSGSERNIMVIVLEVSGGK